MSRPWRVAITRDEGEDGRLSRALRANGLIPGACPTAIEAPPADPQPLEAAARRLEQFDWVVFASARAVRALLNARGADWPPTVKSAAAGEVTAAALTDAGASPPPLVANEPGADPLWTMLQHADSWPNKRVLFPVVADGRRTLIEGLQTAGANVTIVEAYRMQRRAAETIAADWRAFGPDAVILTSPSAARVLADAIGRDALKALRAIVAIGQTTASELETLGLPSSVSSAADFETVARHAHQCLTPA